MTKALEKFDAAVEAVNKHLHMYALINAYQDSNDDHQLSITDTVVLDNAPEDFRILVEELDGIMCELFISEKGGNSPVYYQANNLGYLLSVAESDSFGPLICKFMHKSMCWSAYYG